MEVGNINLAIQMLLKADGHYDGPFGDKLTPSIYEAITKLLNSYGINTKGWTKTRLAVAAEQAVYRAMKIPTGPIDGFVGEDTRIARETYQARINLNWRAEKEKQDEDVPPKPIPVKVKNNSIPTWPKQSECMSFYGRPGTNQVSLQLPYPMRIAWEPKQIVKSWSCHAKVHDNFERIFQRTLDHYGMEKIKELRLDMWGGTLNVRRMRGGSSWSMHSWGIAVDIDPDNNQLKWGRDRATLAKPVYNKFWEFVYDEGAISLGKERNYDWMHFQFARL